MIGKVERTIGEQHTSINQEIELSQKGQIQTVALSGKILSIPTNIPDPRILTLTAMNAYAGAALGASGKGGHWYSDLTLHYATGASLCFASIASSVVAADIGKRIRMNSSYKLFVANGLGSAASAASNSLIVDGAFWKELGAFGANQQKYILVTLASTASTAFIGNKCNFAYEVKGY